MRSIRDVCLQEEDPVKVMWMNMKDLSEAGEVNWWSEVKNLLKEYKVNLSIDEIKKMERKGYTKKVNMAVCNVAYENLKEECKKKEKTANLEYSSFKLQRYFTCLYPNQARIVFKCRSQTLDIKTHLTYKYHDLLCRGCEVEEETLQHIVNCCMPKSIDCEGNRRLYET